MKRWLTWSFLSLATFLVGTIFVYAYLALTAPDFKKVAVIDPPFLKPNDSIDIESLDVEPPEVFIDAARIGRRGKNKVVVQCSFVEKPTAKIRFYSFSTDQTWELRQYFEYVKDNLAGCDPEIKDFNNDGLNDLTYVSNEAARGANELRTLFIYDRARDNLTLIRNSADRPNLEYNKKLNCITSWAFHGATTTTFLRLDGDELKDFAHVDTGAELSVRVLGKNGWRDTYRRKMSEDDIYTRYSTFDPPRP